MTVNETRSICQLTSAHSLDDERILHRFARTVAELGFESTIVGPDDGNISFQGVKFVPCPRTDGRTTFWQHWLSSIFILFWAVRNPKGIYQIHDPDMLLTGIILRLFGRRVIYDVHDDYQASFETRLQNRSLLRLWVPRAWWLFERLSARLFSKVTVADRHLAEKFSFCKPELFGNFPRVDFAPAPAAPNTDTFNVLYVGGVTRGRGLGIALEAIREASKPDMRLHVVGPCRDRQLLRELQAEPKVVLHGRVTWTDLPRYFCQAHVGLALYQPLPAFLYSPGENSVKIIEYMAYGIPVITSNFSGLKRFVETHGIGLTVDPTKPDQVGATLNTLYGDSERRIALSSRARERFESQFNWDRQVVRLESLYRQLLPS